MKKFLLLIILSSSSFISLFSQCDGNRYRNFIFSDITVTSDVLYGSNINETGAAEDLLMDVYEPTGDVVSNRPLVVMCHGGFFLGGDKAGTDMTGLCNDLAKMGYVVASINYRMGIPIANPLQVPYGQAVVRAVQDLKAAIRWFRKDADTGSNQFNIDPANIFTGGSSAGGFMSLHLAYFDESEIPAWLDMTGTGLSGGIEGESGNPGYSSDVKAIISVSGALGDSDWIDPNDTTPACLFHGDADGTVTIDSAMFILFNVLQVTTIEGSNYINQKMDDLDIEHCYHITQGGGHVPYLGNAAVYDTTLSIISNFLSHYVCEIPLDCEYRQVLASVETLADQQSFVYPNPADDRIRLMNYNKNMKACSIIDISGHVVSTQSLSNNGELDIRSLSPGIYFLRTEGLDTSSGMMKVIVE